MNELIEQRASEWQGEEYDDATRQEIKALIDGGKEEELVDRFYQELEFGTGGLRGVMGAGTNRINVYTIRKATQGLANYMLANGGADVRERGGVVAFDSRRRSDEFALEVALVLCGNGIKCYLFDGVCPTPELSFAVRHYKAVAGVNVTASHNPPQYNGYKAYWEDGAQMTPPHDTGVIAEVRKIYQLSQVKRMDESEAREKGLLVTIGEDVDEIYFGKVLSLSQSRELVDRLGADVTIVYTPLHGAGYRHVPEMLARYGFENVKVVPEQAEPDGDFPTIDAPNPEVEKSMRLALDLAKETSADIVLGTDADSDRLGVAVPDREGNYSLLTGNQIGVILIDYYLRRLAENDKLPDNGVVIKTIVTTDLQADIARAAGVECLEVLTGFKWIGRKMHEWDLAKARGEDSRVYLVGGEESYGFLAGDFVRDKDAVIAACLLSEAAVECRSKGKSLFDRLDDIYLEHGLYVERLESVFHEGKEGAEKIQSIMAALREKPPETVGGHVVAERWDIQTGQICRADGCMEGPIDLPPSNVLVFKLDNGCRVTARPSGTEPKIKFYFAIRVLKPEGKEGQDALASMAATAEKMADSIVSDFMGRIRAL